MTYAHHVWRETDRPTVCLQNGEEEEEWDRFSRFNRGGSAVHEIHTKGAVEDIGLGGECSLIETDYGYKIECEPSRGGLSSFVRIEPRWTKIVCKCENRVDFYREAYRPFKVLSPFRVKVETAKKHRYLPMPGRILQMARDLNPELVIG